MVLTLDRLRQIDIPINASNKPNNFSAFQSKLSPYNDSVNLYDALELFAGGGGGAIGTNLGSSYDSTKIDLTSSTGTNTALVSATASTAGILTAADYILLHSAITELVIGDGLTGDGSSGDPLTWGGAFVAGPLTGSGTSFFPLNILNNSITSAHIQSGTILFSDWNQNSASIGQVPQWNGTTWVPVSAALPVGTIGDVLLHDGTTWQAVSEVTETKTGIANVNINLAVTPLSYGKVRVYKNGMLQSVTDDYTRVGSLITFTVALVPLDRVIIIYNF